MTIMIKQIEIIILMTFISGNLPKTNVKINL